VKASLSLGGAKFGAAALTARVAFDELTLESSVWETTVRAAAAVAPNLPPLPEERYPVRERKLLYQWKYRCRRQTYKRGKFWQK
jgi:hypothetical protein